MGAREEKKAIKQEIARRYADWVQGQMVRRSWGQAMLVRRSGLPKQTVSTIVSAEAEQPTLHQIAALVKAFHAEPNEVFAAVGAWSGTRRSDIPSDITQLYLELNEIERDALVKVGHVLRESQERYSGDDPLLSTEERQMRFRPAALDRDIEPPEDDMEPA